MSKKMVILQTAAALFARKGFKDTSMTDLSEAAGVAGGTILYHYKNKEALFLAILMDLKETVVSRSARHFSTQHFSNGLERVEGAIAFYLDLAGTMEDRFLLLHRHDPYGLAEVNPVCRRCLEDIYTCLVDIFQKAIQRGQADGSIRKMPPRKAAWIVFSMVDGIVRLNTYRLYDGSALYHELLAACRRMLRW